MTLAEHLARVQDTHRSTVEQIARLQEAEASLRQQAVECQGQISLLQQLIAEQTPTGDDHQEG